MTRLPFLYVCASLGQLQRSSNKPMHLKARRSSLFASCLSASVGVNSMTYSIMQVQGLTAPSQCHRISTLWYEVVDDIYQSVVDDPKLSEVLKCVKIF